METFTLKAGESFAAFMSGIYRFTPFQVLLLHENRLRIAYTLARTAGVGRREHDVIPHKVTYLAHVRVPKALVDSEEARTLHRHLFAVAQSNAWDPRSWARRSFSPAQRAVYLQRAIATAMLPMRVHQRDGQPVFTPRLARASEVEDSEGTLR